MTSPIRRVLVNGATGALGRATLAAIAQAPQGLTAVAGTRRQPSPLAGAVYVPDDGRVDPAVLRGIDMIINCAGRVDGTVAELAATNVEHVRNLAEAARSAGVSRFVQVSSFSVYGLAERIDQATPIAPAIAYGRSKADADAVLSQDGGGMSVVSLRLPFMFDRAKPALMGPLISLFRRAPVFPVAPYPARRSMLTYPDAATLLVRAGLSGREGVLNAADPEYFTSALLVSLMRERGLHAPLLVRLPGFAAQLIRRMMPSVGRRLFAASALAPEVNWAVGQVLPNGLVEELRSLLDDGARREGAAADA